MSKRKYYSSTIKKFLLTEIDVILGQLLINDEFETSDHQKNAWKKEIIILKEQLQKYKDGEIIFEYTIPRIGHRIDVVCIIKGIIFLLEFKVGEKEYKKSTLDQVMDYALDLKYFHEQSKNRFIVPISISTKAKEINNQLLCMDDKIFNSILCNEMNIETNIENIISFVQDDYIDAEQWIYSRYSPTPTIIEAAQELYRKHSVLDITRNDAGTKNLTKTTQAISKIIDSCKIKKRKAICFVTGVPGAGKTLAGLNIANERHNFEKDEHAIFLSGNGPLVDVLQNALANDRAKLENITKKEALRETKAFIQIIHKFRDDALSTEKAPVEKVVIFDEAQRAWNKDTLVKFMEKKKGILDFEQSEPEFLINIMDRHKDWAVIICLIGGGQEIYNGEAGIKDWFETLRKKFFDWEIYLSDRITDSEYVNNSNIETMLAERKYKYIPELHLGVSLRSFRSEKLSLFIKLLLDERQDKAKQIYKELSLNYPLYITRDINIAKKWVKKNSRGTERYGLLASSGGKRLRAEGIWVPSEINHVAWFLNGKDNVDSSYYLEVPASEFKVQGLEVDYAILAWDADLRYTDNGFDYFRFRGNKWNHVNKIENKIYLKNAYRVLLTRARQGLIIYIPKGSKNDETRLPEYYDGIYKYLKNIGLKEIIKY